MLCVAECAGSVRLKRAETGGIHQDAVFQRRATSKQPIFSLDYALMGLEFDRLFTSDLSELVGGQASVALQLALHITAKLVFGGRLQGFLSLAHISAGIDQLRCDLVAFGLFHQLGKDAPVRAQWHFLQDDVSRGAIRGWA